MNLQDILIAYLIGVRRSLEIFTNFLLRVLHIGWDRNLLIETEGDGISKIKYGLLVTVLTLLMCSNIPVFNSSFNLLQDL